MASVVLDTSIILDYLSAKREHHQDAVNLLEALFYADDEPPVVPAGCIKDAYYILCRHYHNESLVRERLEGFARVICIADLTSDVLAKAFSSNEPDLEDGIVRATAELMRAKAIITRDTSAYVSSFVPSMDARSYCLQIDQ